MRNLIINPTGEKDKNNTHFNDSIINPIKLDQIHTYFDNKQYEFLKSIAINGCIRFWGEKN